MATSSDLVHNWHLSYMINGGSAILQLTRCSLLIFSQLVFRKNGLRYAAEGHQSKQNRTIIHRNIHKEYFTFFMVFLDPVNIQTLVKSHLRVKRQNVLRL